MTASRIVAVVSDFGYDSFYVGAMKAVLMAGAPDCRVVDLTHSIAPHDVDEASFVVDTVFDFFPPGTVFLSVVDPGVGGARENLVVEVDGRFVVGPDNGIVSDVIARVNRFASYVIEDEKIGTFRLATPVGRTFLGRDVFAPAAAALAAGLLPADVASPAKSPPVTVELPSVKTAEGVVSGPARYVDGFGNILTGITRRHLETGFGDVDPGRMAVTAGGEEVGVLLDYYSRQPAGTLMAVLNSWDRIEVSVCGGRASDRFAGRPLGELTVELRAASEG
jgi:hypothetical protein